MSAVNYHWVVLVIHTHSKSGMFGATTATSFVRRLLIGTATPEKLALLSGRGQPQPRQR